MKFNLVLINCLSVDVLFYKAQNIVYLLH